MAKTKFGTLTANTWKSETVTVDHRGLEVVNTSQTGIIYVTLDNSQPPISGGADLFPVLGSRHFDVSGGQVTVNLISTGALGYSVEGAS